MSKYALSQGILLFSFAMVLIGLKESTIVIFGQELPSPPIEFYKGLGVLALIMSLSLMVVTFYGRLATWFQRFLEQYPRSRLQGSIKWLFFVVFLLAYLSSWLIRSNKYFGRVLHISYSFLGRFYMVYHYPSCLACTSVSTARLNHRARK